MQLKEKPELNQINEQSKFLAKTYQPYQPLKERKSVTTVDIQPKEKPELNQINEQSKFLAKTYQPDRPIKEPKSVARVDRQDLRSIKNRKSVAKTYQPYLLSIKEHKSGGGTLLKILVIFFILGWMSAIALPELAKCNGTLGKQSEAKQYLSSMNRAQQANHAEYSAFSNSITALGIGIKTETTNYNYSTSATKNATFSYGVARSNNLRSYVGAVFLVPISPAANDAKTTVSILCAANSPGKTQPANPILQNDRLVCGDGTVEVSK